MFNQETQSDYVTKEENGSEADPINQEENTRERGKEALLFIWETLKIILISLVIIVPIRYYIFQPFFVKGASMEENFQNKDYLIIDEISYRFNEPARGDVIVFRYPKDRSQFFIKRIIGLPGETVEIKNNSVTIYNEENSDGIKLEEKYLSPGQDTFGNSSTKLGESEYYVLGDNRLQSSDSRSWGPVPRENIIGKTFLRLWPLDKITMISKINYSY